MNHPEHKTKRALELEFIQNKKKKPDNKERETKFIPYNKATKEDPLIACAEAHCCRNRCLYNAYLENPQEVIDAIKLQRKLVVDRSNRDTTKSLFPIIASKLCSFNNNLFIAS